MKKWIKIIIDKSNKIIKINKVKRYSDFSKEVDTKRYSYNENYVNKEVFFEFYLKGRYLIWNNYLKNNLKFNEKILSIASGRGINELSLISNNFDIVCSDLEIPECYWASKKLFGNFDYVKLDILKGEINNEFGSIFCVSTFYIFPDLELEKIFNNINKILVKNGILILDFGGSEDNLTTFLFHDIYLVIESYLIYYLSKLFGKQVGLKFDNSFGYRRKNQEIIEFASKFGFKLSNIDEYDFLTELRRSILINKIIKYFPSSKKIFLFLGKRMPYIRMFKFKKI